MSTTATECDTVMKLADIKVEKCNSENLAEDPLDALELDLKNEPLLLLLEKMMSFCSRGGLTVMLRPFLNVQLFFCRISYMFLSWVYIYL